VTARASPRPRRAGSADPVTTEDLAGVHFETDRGALGQVAVSQVSLGRKNRLPLDVDATDAAWPFCQEQPDELWRAPGTAYFSFRGEQAPSPMPPASTGSRPATHRATRIASTPSPRHLRGDPRQPAGWHAHLRRWCPGCNCHRGRSHLRPVRGLGRDPNPMIRPVGNPATGGRRVSASIMTVPDHGGRNRAAVRRVRGRRTRANRRRPSRRRRGEVAQAVSADRNASSACGDPRSIGSSGVRPGRGPGTGRPQLAARRARPRAGTEVSWRVCVHTDRNGPSCDGRRHLRSPTRSQLRP
jgi:hypothetical protein